MAPESCGGCLQPSATRSPLPHCTMRAIAHRLSNTIKAATYLLLTGSGIVGSGAHCRLYSSMLAEAIQPCHDGTPQTCASSSPFPSITQGYSWVVQRFCSGLPAAPHRGRTSDATSLDEPSRLREFTALSAAPERHDCNPASAHRHLNTGAAIPISRLSTLLSIGN